MRALLCLLAIALPGLHAAAATVRVNWQPVDQDVEGGVETVSHYLVYVGRQPRPATVHHPTDGTFSYQRKINAGSKTELHVPDLDQGEIWYLSTAAVDKEGNVSDYSAEVRFEVPGSEAETAEDKSEAARPPPPSTESASKPKPGPRSSGCQTPGHEAGSSAFPMALLAGLLAIRRRD